MTRPPPDEQRAGFGLARWGREIGLGPARKSGPPPGSVDLRARTRPDQAVAITLVVGEQVAADRGRQLRVIELDRVVVSTAGGLLRPGGADLDPADIDQVAGRIVAGAASLGHEAHALGLEFEGGDLSVELGADLLEVANRGHCLSPFA